MRTHVPRFVVAELILGRDGVAVVDKAPRITVPCSAMKRADYTRWTLCRRRRYAAARNPTVTPARRNKIASTSETNTLPVINTAVAGIVAAVWRTAW